MSWGPSTTITGEELRDIITVRLSPHLPSQLTKVTPGVGRLRYDFTPFTGQEPEPRLPDRYWEDSNLAHRHTDRALGRTEAADPEYTTRKNVRLILEDAYEQARILWGNARYVAKLKDSYQEDTERRWKRYQQGKKALEAAFSYLRTREADAEWRPAISRLIDAQEEAQQAATEFDTRARELARVHANHRSEYGYTPREALQAAGIGHIWEWPELFTDPDDFGLISNSYRSRGPWPAEVTIRRMIEEQDTHISKVSRLAGESAGT